MSKPSNGNDISLPEYSLARAINCHIFNNIKIALPIIQT